MREAMHVWGVGVHGKIPVPSPQFCCEPESALKNQVLKKKKTKQTK